MEGRMSQSARLLALVEALRRRQRAAAAAELAEELRVSSRTVGVSSRTVGQDAATLVARGVPIQGGAGGYVLKPGFFLPPLVFGEDEVDALILGLSYVAQRGEEPLQQAADDALAKVAAVLPQEMEDVAGTSGSPARRGAASATATPHLAVVSRAIRAEEKLRLRYTDRKGAATERTIWPFALGFFGESEGVAAWCETRRDFRHFRLDRIASAEASGERYPKRRRILLAEWRLQEDMDAFG
jgi:predicted DNA-binding transcriptional regulator YafY